MYFVNGWLKAALLGLAAISLFGCDISDDLIASDEDKRPAVTAGSSGYLPGQRAADFSVVDSQGDEFVLSDHLAAGRAPADVVVLYFTMWCPICLAHSDHIYSQVMPRFQGRGTVVYALVDYVSGSVSASRASEVANGYAGSDFVTLVDAHLALLDQFNGAMGTVVVIDSDGTILLNEDYRTGAALMQTLDQQLP